MSLAEQSTPAVPMRPMRSKRWAVIILGAGWTVFLLVGLSYAALVQWMGDLDCEASVGDSNYGSRGWSALPPGPTCTFTRELNGFARVDGPTPVMTVWLVVLALGAVAYLALVRRPRRG